MRPLTAFTTFALVCLLTGCNIPQAPSIKDTIDSANKAWLTDTVNMKTCPIEITSSSSLSGGGSTVAKLIALWPGEVDFEGGGRWTAGKR